MNSPIPNDIFVQCAKAYTHTAIENQGHVLIHCISDHVQQLETKQFHNYNDMLHWLYVVFGGLVFVLQIGYSMMASGYVRKKNIVNTMIQNLLNLLVASFAYWSIGYGLAYGGSSYYENEINTTTTSITFVGVRHFCGYYAAGTDTELNYSLWFLQFTMSSISIMIIAGVLTERCQTITSIIYSFIIISFLDPILIHNLTSHGGYFSPNRTIDRYRNIGIIDFACGGSITMFGGCIAISTYIHISTFLDFFK
jgi:ammonium transporter, Amt family